MHPGRTCICLAILLIAGLGTAIAEDDTPERSYRQGQIRAGAFFISNIDTKFMVTPAEVPIGVRIAGNQDLGLDDSKTVPRLMLSYRFSRRHRLDFGWYGLDRVATKILEREITFKDKTFQIGTEVEAFVKTDLYKFSYTWLFHEDNKVLLGLSAGLHTATFDMGIATTDDVIALNERESLTAPLPVLGVRLAYRISPKLAVIAVGDWFFLNFDEYEGGMGDFFTIVEHRTTKHVGIGGGLNVFQLNVEFAGSDINADLRHVYAGAVAYLSFYF
jgi:hypothetical protein